MIRILPILLIISSILCIFIVDFDRTYSKEEYELLKDQVELISWIFSSIIGVISFFGLFIGFIHENKLVTASKILKELYLPYTSSVETIRQNLINYNSYLSRDRIIKFIYFSFLTVSCIVIVVWGTVVGFYTKFQYSFNIQFTVEALINIGIYIVYLLLCLLLVGVSRILKAIILHKDPLRDGYLPPPGKIIDIEYLSTQKMDLDELFLRTSPYLEFYKNPPVSNPTYEVNLVFPIKWKNLKFIIKIFDNSYRTIITTYGNLTEINYIGERYTINLKENLSEELFELLLSGLNGELKIYGTNNKVLSRLLFSIDKNNNDVSFNYSSERIILNKDKIDLDLELIKGITNNNVEFKTTSY